MDKLVIEGRNHLKGSLPVSGSKNTALALFTAALLADGPVTIENIPNVRDVRTLAQIISYTGVSVDFDQQSGVAAIDPTTLTAPEAPYELVKKMRASFYMLGALLGKHGEARVSLPGGCAWGPRPVDLHIDGMKALGASIELDNGYVVAKTPGGRLTGGTFTLNPSSVGATINLLLAATRARGSSVIHNAAREPDVIVFGEALKSMGAKIDGLGTPTIEIEGVDYLNPVPIRNCSDRIELGTFMIAAAIAGKPGDTILLKNAQHEHLGHAFKEAFEKTGTQVVYNDNSVSVTVPESIQPADITTAIYPGFPTDLQAQWTILMSQASGKSTITDTIYLDRFKHIPELQRMGLVARVVQNAAHVEGGHPLKGAQVMSSDLRASVSLVLAALVASGETQVLRVYHLDRGYENLETKLANAGIAIRRERYDEWVTPTPPIPESE
ncbi:MAG: UDP-N-acetylglucosamine 1-carboxyvinyltransferase [Rhodothermaceae bacterium]|nr:UDP-N-acetylglucosamine 1-carboxyvinyltransferase [Rhodothermaceae bacterium]